MEQDGEKSGSFDQARHLQVFVGPVHPPTPNPQGVDRGDPSRLKEVSVASPARRSEGHGPAQSLAHLPRSFRQRQNFRSRGLGRTQKGGPCLDRGGIGYFVPQLRGKVRDHPVNVCIKTGL